MNTPTIFIPGIQGTKLMNTNTFNFDVIWSSIKKYFENIYDLELKENQDFDDGNSSIIERADIEDLAYKEALKNIQHNTGSQIFIFGYDWRKSCAVNGRKLKEYVEYLKIKLNVSSFNFLTHSMGGLVFSCFLKELDGKYDIIERAVLAAPPFLGSVNALVALVVGEGGVKFPLFNSNDAFRKIARTFPAVYELCPVYPEAMIYEDGSAFDIYNNGNWQSNLFYKKNDDDHEPEMIVNRINMLKNFRSDNPAMIQLDKLPDGQEGKLLIIAGNNEYTKNKVKVIRQKDSVNNYFDFESFEETKQGDGVVPLESSTIYKAKVLTISVDKKQFQPMFHALFLNDGRVQSIIYRFLNKNISDKKWWNVIDGSVTKL